MRTVAAIAAASLLVAAALSAIPWSALVARVQIPEPYEGPVMRVVVEPGQTLWSLARTYRPDEDPRRVVDWIRSLNPSVNPGRLQVGQVVLVPMELEVAEATPWRRVGLREQRFGGDVRERAGSSR